MDLIKYYSTTQVESHSTTQAESQEDSSFLGDGDQDIQNKPNKMSKTNS